MVKPTATQAEVNAVLTSLRVAQIKLTRMIEEGEVEALRELRNVSIDLDNLIARLEQA